MNNFELYYPVKPWRFNQIFGANPQIYVQFGIKGHNGLDGFATYGQTIYASHDGMAKWEIDANQGEGVVIVSNDEYDYKNQKVHFKSVYWHMVDGIKDPKFVCPIPRDGTMVAVKTGDIIGYADNTGFSTGTHVHWGLKPCVKGIAPLGDPSDIPSWSNV